VPVVRIAVSVVLVALVVACAVLFLQSSDLSSRVSRLQNTTGTQAQLRSQANAIRLQANQIDALQAQLATATSANKTLATRVATMSNLTKPTSFAAQLHVIYNCIPQLETQVNDLTLAGVDSGFPYIQDNAQVSGDCSTLIYGPSTAP
jgi:septal ring factor EnvC (AmiA/AmiB activator)